jgi:hypothetical protein
MTAARHQANPIRLRVGAHRARPSFWRRHAPTLAALAGLAAWSMLIGRGNP